jgi:hypothetical protein
MANKTKNMRACIDFMASGLTPDWISDKLARIPEGETVVGLAEIWLNERDIANATRDEVFAIARRVTDHIGEMIRAGAVRELGSDWQIKAGLGPTRKTIFGNCRVLIARTEAETTKD